MYRWFSLRSKRGMKIEVHAGVKVCCKRFQLAFAKFFGRPTRTGPLCIFPRNNDGIRRHYREISYCPFCGSKIKFVHIPEIVKKPLARGAAAR